MNIPKRYYDWKRYRHPLPKWSSKRSNIISPHHAILFYPYLLRGYGDSLIRGAISVCLKMEGEVMITLWWFNNRQIITFIGHLYRTITNCWITRGYSKTFYLASPFYLHPQSIIMISWKNAGSTGGSPISTGDWRRPKKRCHCRCPKRMWWPPSSPGKSVWSLGRRVRFFFVPLR